MDQEHLRVLIGRVLLDGDNWLAPSIEETLVPPGLVVPLHTFVVTLFDYLQVQLNCLNPNGIKHTVAFIALCLCKGYLGVEPNFNLW